MTEKPQKVTTLKSQNESRTYYIHFVAKKSLPVISRI